MSLSQLDLAMANLRIRLAEIEDRERQLDAQVSQFRQQLRRVPRQAVYGQAGLEASLAAMGEIEERLADAEAVRGRLIRIKSTASQELEALVVLKQVDQARTTLVDLKRQVVDGGPETEAEIRRLEEFIAVNSKRAEQSITERYYDERESGRP